MICFCCNSFPSACLHDSVEVIDITSYTYSGLAQDFESKKNGYKIHFSADALPPEVDECQVHVESSLCGQFQFPENTELISGVYWITTGQEFVKPVTVEFQHCAKPEHIENLTFVVTKSSREDFPYKFDILEGGMFSYGTQYGSINLTHFCGLGIVCQSQGHPSLIQTLCCRALPPESDMNYFARLYHKSNGTQTWEMHFVITRDLELHITVSINSTLLSN